MKCISRPPSRLPRVFASFGRISSVISLRDSATERVGSRAAKSMDGSLFVIELPSSVRHHAQTRNAEAARAMLRSTEEAESMDRIAMLKEILAQNPNDAFARYGLAMEHANQGDTATALEEFQPLTTAHPDYH